MTSTCPSDYDRVIREIGGMKCRKKCPSGFKYLQTTEGGVVEERCVYIDDNRYFVKLEYLPPVPTNTRPPQWVEDMYVNAESKFQADLQSAAMRAASEQGQHDAIAELNKEHEQQGVDYHRVSSEFASYKTADDVMQKLKSVNDSLHTVRPPTVTTDVGLERRKLSLETSAPNMLLFQIALVILVLCLLAYLFLTPPASYYISFLLLSVGVALGIFLRK